MGGGSGSGRMVLVVVMVLCIRCDGGIVMVVPVTASIKMAVEISTNLFSCLFCGGICGFCSGGGGSDISWVVIAFVVMARYWLSSDTVGDDGSCCNANGGSCD